MQSKIFTGLGFSMWTSLEAIIRPSTQEICGVGRGNSKVSPEPDVKMTQNIS